MNLELWFHYLVIFTLGTVSFLVSLVTSSILTFFWSTNSESLVTLTILLLATFPIVWYLKIAEKK